MLEIHLDGYPAFSDLSGAKVPGLPANASEIAKKLGIDVPNLNDVLEKLKIEMPGLPFDPVQIADILSAKDPAGAALKVAENLPIPIPPPGMTIGMAVQTIETVVGSAIDIGGKIADWISGGPQKRDRRDLKIKEVEKVFNRYMDEDPLRIYSGGGSIPSAEFMGKWKAMLIGQGEGTPSKYWQGISKDGKVPKWLVGSGDWHHDGYSGSGDYLSKVFGTEKMVLRFYADRMKKPENKTKEEIALRQLALQITKKASEIAKSVSAKTSRKAITSGREIVLIRRAIKTDLKKLMLEHPEFYYLKQAGQILGFRAYGLPLLALLKKRYPESDEYKQASQEAFKYFNEAAEAVLKDPEVQKKIQDRGKTKQAEQTVIKKAAEQPQSKQAQATTKKLDKKAEDLSKSKKRRMDNAQKAREEAARLRQEVAKLKKQLASRSVLSSKKEAERAKRAGARAQAAERAAVVNEQLAKADAIQEGAVKALKTAVQKGKPEAAALLTNKFNQVAEVKSKLRVGPAFLSWLSRRA